ncbi:hypothetical protein RFI_28057, partial [Reticulomyxa filosa]
MDDKSLSEVYFWSCAHGYGQFVKLIIDSIFCKDPSILPPPLLATNGKEAKTSQATHNISNNCEGKSIENMDDEHFNLDLSADHYFTKLDEIKKRSMSLTSILQSDKEQQYSETIKPFTMLDTLKWSNLKGDLGCISKNDDMNALHIACLHGRIVI